MKIWNLLVKKSQGEADEFIITKIKKITLYFVTMYSAAATLFVNNQRKFQIQFLFHCFVFMIFNHDSFYI